MVFEPAPLHLRFRDDAATSGPPAPPDVDAFLRGPDAFLRGPDAFLRGPLGPADSRIAEGMDDELGVLPGARPVDPAGPLLIFLQHPEFEIPAPGYDHSLPDLATWSVRPTTFGWVASVSPPTRTSTRGASPRRAVQVLAGCLALTLPGSPHALANALADAPASSSAPASGKASDKPPTSPPAIVPAPASPAPTSAPTPAPAPTPTPEPTPSAEIQPTAAPAWTPPAPRVQDTRAVADAAWEGIDGFVVIVELKGGRKLQGRIGAVQADTFTLIESSDGQILVIPKSGVSSVRAYVPPPVPTQTGGGLIAGGSVLTALGVPVFISGIAFVALCPSCIYLHVPMLVVGGGALGGGIPMIARGIQRRTAFQKALEEHRIVPMVSRTPYHGWTGGLQIRF